jgi:hypothetical protein
LVNSGGYNGDTDIWFVRVIKDHIQVLTDEISAFGILADEDAHTAYANRQIDLRQRTIGRLRRFLPAIPTTPNADRGGV